MLYELGLEGQVVDLDLHGRARMDNWRDLDNLSLALEWTSGMIF